MAKLKVKGKIQPNDVLDELNKICPNKFVNYSVTKYRDGSTAVDVYAHGSLYHTATTFKKALDSLKKQIKREGI